MIEVEFKENLQDKLKLNNNYFFTEEFWKIIICSLLLWAVGGYAIYLFFRENKELYIILAIILFALGILYFPITYLKQIVGILKRNAKGKEEFRNFVIKENSFECTEKESKVEYAYDKIYKVAETKKYFFFYLSQDQASIIPKKVLRESDIEKISKIIKEQKSNFIKYNRSHK